MLMGSPQDVRAEGNSPLAVDVHLLHQQSANTCEYKGLFNADVSVMVKRTFIEIVQPPVNHSLRRSMSDSILDSLQSDSEQPWNSANTWKKSLVDKFQDASDASTCVSLEVESTNEFPNESDDKCEQKYVAWSDDEWATDVIHQNPLVAGFTDSWCVPTHDVPFMPTKRAVQAMPLMSRPTSAPETISHEWRTTVMFRNMPNNYTRDMLLRLLDSMDFAGCYDLAYLPIDFKTQAGLGYAFIDFVSSAQALRCFHTFEGFSGWEVPTDKVCSLTWGGPLQGLEAHISRYQNSPVMHRSIPDAWKPALFVSGARIAFPPPTKPIRPPKITLNQRSNMKIRGGLHDASTGSCRHSCEYTCP
jgi:hypothetical protein